MSYAYKYKEGTDTLSFMVSRTADCLSACKKMMQYKNDQIGFAKWFDKARTIDKRTTYLFLREHYQEIPEKTEGIIRGFVVTMNREYSETLIRLQKTLDEAGMSYNRKEIERWKTWPPYDKTGE